MRHGGIKPSILRTIDVINNLATRVYEIIFAFPTGRIEVGRIEVGRIEVGKILASRTIERKRQDMCGFQIQQQRMSEGP